MVKKKRRKGAAARRLDEIAGRSGEIPTNVIFVAERFLFGVDCPPTNLRQLADRLGVRSIDYEELPVSGLLRSGREGISIAISSTLGPLERRYTIAHELGHAVFEMSGPGSPRQGDEIEEICDLFADEFLVPRLMLRVGLPSIITIDLVETLSRKFEVATSVIARQLASISRGFAFFESDGSTVDPIAGDVTALTVTLLPEELRRALVSEAKSASGSATIYLSTAKIVGPRLLTWKKSGSSSRAAYVLAST